MEIGNTFVDISDEELLDNYRVMIIPEGGDITQQYSIPLKKLKRLMEREDGERETL